MLTLLTVLTVKVMTFKKYRLSAVTILKEIEIMPVFTHHYHYTLSILPNETANIIKQNWNQFLLLVTD